MNYRACVYYTRLLQGKSLIYKRTIFLGRFSKHFSTIRLQRKALGYFTSCSPDGSRSYKQNRSTITVSNENCAVTNLASLNN